MNRVSQIMLGIGTLALLSGTSAVADSTTSPGKSAAYSSVNGVTLSTGFPVMTSVTIEKGKKKRVLEVTIMALNNDSTAGSLGVRPVVNGQLMMEPLAGGSTSKAVSTTCNPSYINCTVVGDWWLDLDQAEAAFPGLFINAPLTIDATVGTGVGTPIGSVSLQARLVKK
jgi:hypothetical protein